MRSARTTRLGLLLLVVTACGSVAPAVTDRGPTEDTGSSQPTTGMPPATAPVPELTMHAEATQFARMTPVPQPTVVLAGVADAPAVMRVTSALSERGHTPEPSGESRVEFLADAQGQSYRIGEGWLLLHLYPTAEAAAGKTAEIQRGLDNPVADPPAPPHAFRCDNVIALYMGTDEEVTAALTELCGPEVAGRH